MYKLHVLASGSAGNAAVVEDAVTGAGILIDCGLSNKAFVEACATCGFDPRNITDVLITHEHSDHIKGIGVMLRGLAKRGCFPTVHVDPKVLAASSRLRDDVANHEVIWLKPEAAFSTSVGTVYPFATSHDAAASYGFRIESARSGKASDPGESCSPNKMATPAEASNPGRFDSVGFMTDTGVVTPQAHQYLENVGILALESNHDPDMLKRGPYPYHTKQRILSSSGHLSNQQSAQELDLLLSNQLRSVVAMHVSQNNNLYDLALSTLAETTGRAGHPARVHVGYQARPISVS